MFDSDSLDVLRQRLAVARGDAPARLLIRNVRLLNVLSGEIHPADVAVHDGVFAGFGPRDAEEVLDAEGRYLCPGLIDGHIHIESTLLSAAGLRGRRGAPTAPAPWWPIPTRSPTCWAWPASNTCWPAAGTCP